MLINRKKGEDGGRGGAGPAPSIFRGRDINVASLDTGAKAPVLLSETAPPRWRGGGGRGLCWPRTPPRDLRRRRCRLRSPSHSYRRDRCRPQPRRGRPRRGCRHSPPRAAYSRRGPRPSTDGEGETEYSRTPSPPGTTGLSPSSGRRLAHITLSSSWSSSFGIISRGASAQRAHPPLLHQLAPLHHTLTVGLNSRLVNTLKPSHKNKLRKNRESVIMNLIYSLFILHLFFRKNLPKCPKTASFLFVKTFPHF